MINAAELLFVVDEKNNPMDPLPRKVVHENNLFHRTTGIWVINEKKQVLCQKRSLKKDIKPGYFEAFFGGHVAFGESYQDNAVKEIAEEIGIAIDFEDLIPYMIFKSDKPTHKEFQHVFGLKTFQYLSTFRYEKDEIDEIFWKDIDELQQILVNKKDNQWVVKPWDKDVLTWLPTLLA